MEELNLVARDAVLRAKVGAAIFVRAHARAAALRLCAQCACAARARTHMRKVCCARALRAATALKEQGGQRRESPGGERRHERQAALGAEAQRAAAGRNLRRGEEGESRPGESPPSAAQRRRGACVFGVKKYAPRRSADIGVHACLRAASAACAPPPFPVPTRSRPVHTRPVLAVPAPSKPLQRVLLRAPLPSGFPGRLEGDHEGAHLHWRLPPPPEAAIILRVLDPL